MSTKQVPLKAFLLMMALLTLTACGSSSTNQFEPEESQPDSGVLTLRINPEIQMEYNKDGLVTALSGTNDTGEEIAALYPDYIGKESNDVLKELVALIHDAGYLVDQAEGSHRKIVLELEPGSVMPSDDFLKQMSHTIQETVAGLDLSPASSNQQKKTEEKSAEPPSAPSESVYISTEQAKKTALFHAGLEGTEVAYGDVEFDEDDGIPYYEIEFYYEGYEYEVAIHAATGNILEYERETDD